MRLTKFLKIAFKRLSTYIKDKVKFLKISFNLSVMRLGLSHEYFGQRKTTTGHRYVDELQELKCFLETIEHGVIICPLDKNEQPILRTMNVSVITNKDLLNVIKAFLSTGQRQN